MILTDATVSKWLCITIIWLIILCVIWLLHPEEISGDNVFVIKPKIDKVYIANLERRPDRKLHSLSEISKLSPLLDNVTFFEAVDGKTLSSDYIRQVVSLRTYHNIQKSHRALDIEISTLGGVGCYLTHFKIWNDMINNGHDTILVLEDDFVTRSAYKTIATYLNNIPNDYCIAFLYHGSVPFTNSYKFLNEYWSLSNNTRMYGTLGYVLSRDCAKDLIKGAFPIEMQVDAYINHLTRYSDKQSKRLYSNINLFGHEAEGFFDTDIQDMCISCNTNILMEYITRTVVFVTVVITLCGCAVVSLAVFLKFCKKDKQGVDRFLWRSGESHVIGSS